MLSHSSCINPTVQEELAAARLALSLAYFFISPEISPVPTPSISHYITLPVSHVLVHALARICTTRIAMTYRLIPSLASSILYQLALVLDILCVQGGHGSPHNENVR
jgi:hypothetical protein